MTQKTIPTKIDHKTVLKSLYKPSARKAEIIDVPPLNYLMIDGRGKPDKPEFQEDAGLIYPLAYTIKFAILKEQGVNFAVMPMEVKWHVQREKKEFGWVMMILQPELVTRELYERSVEQAIAKTGKQAIANVRLDGLNEGLCVQMLHIGPYELMEETMAKMVSHATVKGYQAEKDTHDIYLNSILKAKPENLRTVMRLKIKE